MLAKRFDPVPAPGDIVYCCFPETIGTPAVKPRPALVVGVVEFKDGTPGVNVAYGTSKRVDDLRSGEFAVTPLDGIAFRESGLSYPTKFDVGNVVSLPYTDEWFRVPPARPHGNQPRLGFLHASLMRRATAAFNAASKRGND